MIRDYSKNYHNLTRLMKELEAKIPATIKGFNELQKASILKGVLTTKTKELIALGIAITSQCNGCIVLQINDALKSGATSEEIIETIGIAVLMGGAPALVYGCEAMEALEQFVVLE